MRIGSKIILVYIIDFNFLVFSLISMDNIMFLTRYGGILSIDSCLL